MTDNETSLDLIAFKVQQLLSKLESDIEDRENKADLCEATARMHRKQFTEARNMEDWRARYEAIEKEIRFKEITALTHRMNAQRYRDEAEEAKMLLAYHAARRQHDRIEH